SFAAWADHFTGTRTVANPASLMSLKKPASSLTPQSPSFGASRALPKLTPRPSALFTANTSAFGSAFSFPFGGSAAGSAGSVASATATSGRESRSFTAVLALGEQDESQ